MLLASLKSDLIFDDTNLKGLTYIGGNTTTGPNPLEMLTEKLFAGND